MPIANTRPATPAENLRILRARLFDQLSPAERRELNEAAEILERATAPLPDTAEEEIVRDLAQRMISKWQGPTAMLLAFLRLPLRERRARIFLAAATVARNALDNCQHEACIATRKRFGYSNCAGGHLAREVFESITSAQTAFPV